MAKSKENLLSELEDLRTRFDDWTYDIPLPHGIWTKGNQKVPHTRLKRVLQAVSDISRKPINECRVLDLACLDGIYSIEFALQGARTIGVEIREANIKKAAFCGDALGLENLEFRQDDVRNISEESYGRFDVILCSGILYHLPADDAARLIRTMFEMVDGMVVIDTHFALSPEEAVLLDGEEYRGKTYREHPENATQEQKLKSLWSSVDNETSFWFTKESLLNLLAKAGFSSIHECFNPPHINYGKPGLESRDRGTFIAIKRDAVNLVTSPAANGFVEDWPERSFFSGGKRPVTKNASVKDKSAAKPKEGESKSLLQKIFSCLKSN